jgi:glycosyltransferase involved in cell wall biosynthesis
MKIAFVCGFAWEPKGTARARAFPLAAELVNKGHEVSLFLTPYDNPADSGTKKELEGVRVVNIEVGQRPGFRQAPWIAQRLCSAIRQYSPDVVHIFKPKGYAGAACTWLLLRGFRSVALDLDDWEGWGGWNNVKTYPWIVKEYIDRQEKWLIRRVPVLTAASRALERRAQELRKSPQGVLYIPNGWSFRKAPTTCESAAPSMTDGARKSFGLPDGPAIFYGGHFDPADDVLFFCRATEHAARQFGATLVFVGEGPEIPKVKQFFAQRDGLIALFFPRLPHEQFLQLVAASDIAAFPYPDTPIYQAKCSARIVDYMAMGKAVLTTTVGQNLDYLVDGESGVLIAPGDASRFGQAIERLLADPELRLRLGQNARKRIREKFSWDGAAVENCLAAYGQLSGFSSLGFWHNNAQSELKSGEKHANLHRLGGRQAD